MCCVFELNFVFLNVIDLPDSFQLPNKVYNFDQDYFILLFSAYNINPNLLNNLCIFNISDFQT